MSLPIRNFILPHRVNGVANASLLVGMGQRRQNVDSRGMSTQQSHLVDERHEVYISLILLTWRRTKISSVHLSASGQGPSSNVACLRRVLTKLGNGPQLLVLDSS